MYPLLDTSNNLIRGLAQESGFEDQYGQLLTPLTNYRICPDIPLGIDNGGYSKACPKGYLNLLMKALPHLSRVLWATLPDIPGDAMRTMELFRAWRPHVSALGYPIALVAQDGMENLEIPWNLITGIFIGGTTEWKLGKYAVGIIRTAKWMGKATHVGRVNTPGRWEIFAKEGVDTFDGSGLVRPLPGSKQAREGIRSRRMSFGESPVPSAGIPE